MIEFPKILTPFYEKDVYNVKVACNIQNGFSFRKTEIMQKLMELCETHDTETVCGKLLEEYDAVVIQSLFQKLETYQDFLFQKDSNHVGMDQVGYYRIMTLNIVHSCNLRCRYCFEEIDFRQDNLVMDEKVAFTAIDKFVYQLKSNPGHIIFTGGEPVINIHLIKKIVEYCVRKKYDMTYMIKTNGTLINEEIMRFLISNKFKVQISLDGCKTANDLYRVYANGMGTYDDVISVIDKFVEENYAANLSLHGTVTHETIQYLSQSFRTIRDKYAHIDFDVKWVMDTKNKGRSLTKEDKGIFLNCLLKHKPLRTSIQDNQKGQASVCGIGKWHIAIDTNGDIYPCYRLMGKQEYHLGNILYDVLKEYQIAKLDSIYRMSQKECCKKCYALKSCATGCYADKLLIEDGSECEYGEKETLDSILSNYFSDINRVALIPKI